MFRRLPLTLVSIALMATLLPGGAALAGGEVSTQSASTLTLQKALKEKGFYRGPLDGSYGSQTQHAVMAFRKEIGAGRSYSWSSSLWDELDLYQEPYTEHDEPDRVEINLRKQTAHLFRNGGLVATFDISSGNGEIYYVDGQPRIATTPTGSFSVYRRTVGWHESTLGLGLMLDPWFFVGGIALHGSNSVPPYPASHGCVRLTTSDSNFINSYMFIGMPVHVFSSSGSPVYASDGPFADVPAGHTFIDAVSWMVEQGITQGCRPYFFCPDSDTTRGQTAAFMKRTLEPYLGGADPGSFVDIAGHPFEAGIGWLAGHGITQGCNPPANDRYCPDRSLTRGQFAAMVKRSVGDLIPVDPGAIDPDRFSDTDGSVFKEAAVWMAAAGITIGCNPPDNDRFCPSDTLTRAQISAFLKRVVERL